MINKPIEVKSIKFSTLKEWFDQKIFAVPDIQREFVWNKKKIVKLLDSISKHYPIGSFLICRIPAKKHKRIREGVVLPHFNPYKNKKCFLVVDGQQRLSVIYSVIKGTKIHTKRYKDPIIAESICLSHRGGQESEFEFYAKDRKENVKLTDILSQQEHRESKKKGRIKECKRAFDSYSFPFIFIDGFDEKKMKEAFIRLNTGGTSLSTVDKIFAEAYHKDTDLRAHINNLVEHELKRGYQYIEKGHIVKSIAANLGHKDFVGSTLHTFAKKLSNPKDILHIEYVKKRHKIEHAIKLAADYLTSKFGNASYIPYPAMLSILSIFYFSNNNRQPNSKQIEEVKKWFWITGFTERYSGAKQRQNQLNDADEMRLLALKKTHKLYLEGKRRADKVSMRSISKTRYTTRGALRNSFFCYLISKNPVDFYNGEPIHSVKEDVSSVFNKKNDHHIFPRRLLKDYVDQEEINRLINICFQTFGENVRISETPPWLYLKGYKNQKDFKKKLASHAIPYDSSLLEKGDVLEKYKRFGSKRKELIKKELIHLMGNIYVED